MEDIKLTAGAGVDPAKVIKLGKRLRNWYRKHDIAGGLRSYARVLATTSDDNRKTALRWLASKGARP